MSRIVTRSKRRELLSQPLPPPSPTRDELMTELKTFQPLSVAYNRPTGEPVAYVNGAAADTPVYVAYPRVPPAAELYIRARAAVQEFEDVRSAIEAEATRRANAAAQEELDYHIALDLAQQDANRSIPLPNIFPRLSSMVFSMERPPPPPPLTEMPSLDFTPTEPDDKHACPICMEKEYKMVTTACQHVMCPTCCKQHLQTFINDHKPVRCATCRAFCEYRRIHV